ncbi:CaiB/BaiF CoA-transferase family protein [Thalassospira sp. GB04J01]|uniref:CaiB/BaiF CoA transferase family protein n=1 Tax=Thalassospira sp. GB04J01 TaxID=1485225 RepID=UPI000C9CB452|nr:CaiB/BaiF CoA-transferase family protein [Thalassospira sp. GB04J01]|tara:strand:+ start:109535 stop:110752 length:1218 start_codon:yes stop_codon:yes gene_type:complete
MQNTKPLHGVTVLDLTNVLAGPFCCHQLAHLGATVIKVEAPGRGDLARQLGADAGLNEKLMGVSFLAQNAGKKSITLNLKDPRGKDILKKLVKQADVLVENFRPGVMDRLELDYDVLSKVNPALIYCAISGFGQSGPMKKLPAYDQIVQGLSGIMTITGEEDKETYRVGYPVADTIGGLTAACAISSALAGRALGNNEGKGSFIDISMLESVVATMGWVVSNFLIAGQQPTANGNDNFTSSPSGAFRTADGQINIAANKQEQFEAVCDVLELDTLKADPRFLTRSNRLSNRKELAGLLERVLQTGRTDDWVLAFNAVGVPAGAVLTVPQALSLPQIADRGMIADFASVPGVERDIRVLRTGMKLNGEAPSVDAPPPVLGQDNETILAGLGLSADEIKTLKAEGVL